MISLFYILSHIIAYQRHHASAISLLFHQAVQQIEHPRYPKVKLNIWSPAPRSAQHWHNVCKGQLMKGQQLTGSEQRRKKVGHSGITWVATDQQHQVIGFINLAVDFKQQGYINHLYVAPQFAGQGIATQLLAYAQQWALKQGYQQLTVDASYLSKALFIKAGFELIHSSIQQKQQISLNGFYMRKLLHA